jgi:hypothetical protein
VLLASVIGLNLGLDAPGFYRAVVIVVLLILLSPFGGREAAIDDRARRSAVFEPE